jgi:DNA (cytosine-5)-methyltransferase 1
VDNTKEFTHLGLCAGYGGIELGLHRVIRTLRTVALCEIEAFACANLVSKMEAGLMDCAPIWTDLKTFPWAEFRDRVDILTGGYPCQPFSAAGKRLGTEDPRHLWPFIASGIRILRPKLCFFENVEGHISLGLREVIGELERIGYQSSWGIFSASVDAGAPHQRKRVFILAYDKRERVEKLGRQIAVGSQQHSAWDDGDNAWPSRPGEQQFAWEPPRVVTQEGRPLEHTSHGSNGEQPTEQQGRHSFSGSSEEGARMANANELRLEEHGLQHASVSFGSGRGQNAEAMGNSDHGRLASGLNAGSGTETDRGGQGDIEQAESRQAQPALGRDPHGPARGMDYAELQVSCDNRTDELRLLGNGVVPATAERAFLTLMQELLKGTN